MKTAAAHNSTAPAAPDRFLEELRDVPLGREIADKIASRRFAERSGQLEQLIAAEKAYAAELPGLDEGLKNAIDELRRAELAVLDARQGVDISNASKAAAWAEMERLRGLYATQLRQTASPAIAEFRGWCNAELDALGKRLETRTSTERNLLGRKTEVTASNADSLVHRRLALTAALRKAEALQLEPSDEIVEQEIARLKSALPRAEGLKL